LIGRVRAGGALVGAALLAGVASVAGCTAGPDPVVTPPPPPPAACMLDTAAFAATTGLTWIPDATTASDTRCVYDPTVVSIPAEGPAFVTVDVAAMQGTDPAAELASVAGLCTEGSRADVGAGGFVCRFQGGSVFAAAVRRSEVVTIAASAVPPGTTAAQLVVAFDQQLTALGA
jgi:hypothetical protein